MPFGLTNTPSTFQSFMNHVFQKFLRRFALGFYDIILYNMTLQDHVLYMLQVFEVMVQNNLLVKQFKCVFGFPRVGYLGHFISTQGVATYPRKIKIVQQ